MIKNFNKREKGIYVQRGRGRERERERDKDRERIKNLSRIQPSKTTGFDSDPQDIPDLTMIKTSMGKNKIRL